MRRVAFIALTAMVLSHAAVAEERPSLAKPCEAQIAGVEPREGEAFAYAMAEMMNTRFDGTPLNAELAAAFDHLRARRSDMARSVIDALRTTSTAHRDRDQRRAIWAARIAYDVVLRCFSGGMRPMLPKPQDAGLALCFLEQRRTGNLRPGKTCGMDAADWLIGYPEGYRLQHPPVPIYLDDPEVPVAYAP